MEFKKTVAGISAAAIAVTQVAAVIPMNTFAATEDVASANVQFALNYKAGGKTNSVTAAASAKTATVNADEITSVEDFGLSFSGAITGADLADGDKYTFTANGLTVTAKERTQNLLTRPAQFGLKLMVLTSTVQLLQASSMLRVQVLKVLQLLSITPRVKLISR